MAKDDSDNDNFIVFIMMVLAVLAIIFLATVAFAAVGGVLWGGGTAIANYSKSFKENIFDSNRAVSIYCIIAFISLSVWLYNYVYNVFLGLAIE